MLYKTLKVDKKELNFTAFKELYLKRLIKEIELNNKFIDMTWKTTLGRKIFAQKTTNTIKLYTGKKEILEKSSSFEELIANIQGTRFFSSMIDNTMLHCVDTYKELINCEILNVEISPFGIATVTYINSDGLIRNAAYPNAKKEFSTKVKRDTLELTFVEAGLNFVLPALIYTEKAEKEPEPKPENKQRIQRAERV